MPVVALLTDFGSQDHYVGAMKGAILTVCPEATLVDLAHEIPAHDVTAGALALASAWRDFPAQTVFVAVVDPGVGSSRRGLALAAGGYRFVGPDNGLLSLVMAEADGPQALHRIANRALTREAVSATFHARDVFGPVAAHLARGLEVAEVGPAIDDPVRLVQPVLREVGPGEWEATVVHVDRFGNLITNLLRRDLDRVLATVENDFRDLVVVVEGEILPLARTYADVPEGEGCALVGSSGRLEVAVHRGNAARQLGAGTGAPVRVRAVGPVL
ncbi:MAG TPA: SAM-dependent chlorinase/fluorinase [Vicinamibacteria bacterium]|nr:SAM-dependent chlorinase/fluorinase [Vicinamibacteria bacterium]